MLIVALKGPAITMNDGSRIVEWKNKSWILHQDHAALIIKSFFAKYGTSTLLTDLVPCDFFMFLKVKETLRFETVEAVKVKVMETMKMVLENYLNNGWWMVVDILKGMMILGYIELEA